MYNKDYPIHTSFFVKVPIWNLLVDFLCLTKLILGQLSPIVIRILRGIDALNKIHGTNLGLEDVKYYYSLTKGQYGWSLKARNDAPSLVYTLFDFYKGADEDAIIVTGNIELDPVNKPIPYRASRLGW